MPGVAFARGFVKTYASLLDLDAEELVSMMPRPDAIVTPVQEPHERDPFLGSISSSSWDGRWDPRWNGPVSSAGWILFAIAAATGGYCYMNRPATPVAAVAAKSEPAKLEQPKLEQPKSEAAKIESAKIESGKVEPASAEPRQNPAPAPQTAMAAVSNSGKPVQVVLTATESSWLNIVADGKAGFTGVMNANERREFDADTNVKIVAGNAGGVRISLNGRDLDPLGSHGQVRSVKLTAAGPQL